MLCIRDPAPADLKPLADSKEKAWAAVAEKEQWRRSSNPVCGRSEVGDTGTSEIVAKSVQFEMKCRGMKAKCMTFNDISVARRDAQLHSDGLGGDGTHP